MLLPAMLNSVTPMLMEKYTRELLELNHKTKGYGLVLTLEDAKCLIEVRNKALCNFGRIELGIEVTKGLIDVFSRSSYINEENYIATLNELQEIFYYLKNETEDKIGDSMLIVVMKDYFENICGGSLELLKSVLENYARDFRRDLQIIGLEGGK